MFDYKLIEAYAAVIQEGGFDKASRKLHVTQSAVSQRIKQLEEQFGQILLVRTTPPAATSFGARILKHHNQVSRLEADLQGEWGGMQAGTFSSLPIGLNADSLATWFLEAVKPFLEKNNIVLDLRIDDQDNTHQLLKDGQVLGCISTRKTPLQGCAMYYLGEVEYSLYCSDTFREKWFGGGFSLAAAEKAPMITFNRKDLLNLKILKNIFGATPRNYATYYVPSSEMFIEFVASSLAYGAIPQQQSRRALARGDIHDLTPQHHEHVALFWHCWNIDSSMLRGLTEQLQRGFAAASTQSSG